MARLAQSRIDAITCIDESERQPLINRADASSSRVVGTVKLTQGEVVYIPPPTADPQDPLNMTAWQKNVVIIVVSLFATLGLSLVAGFSGLLGFYVSQYAEQGKDPGDITHLMTYPTLTMGIGNLIGMPIAIAVGRRVIVLVSTLVLVIGAVLCATAQTYEAHLAARLIVGLAAGQSESVVPMIIQEIHFLHERSKTLMIQQTIQVIASTIWVLCASPIAGAIGPRWWYGLGAILAAIQLVASVFLLPETKYERPPLHSTTVSESDIIPSPILVNGRVPLDFNKYASRTWQSDMRLWTHPPEWHKVAQVYKQATQVIFFPAVLWAIWLNGVALGINVAISTTFPKIVTSAPYYWPATSVSFANGGQIVIALLALPLLGHGSDRFVQWRAARNSGFHEPETRLIPLALPIIVGIFTVILYGQGASDPQHYHWFLYIWAVAGTFFAFIGSAIVSITYLLDSYPTKAGPILVLICSLRGLISFVLSDGIASMLSLIGYRTTFAGFGCLLGVIGSLAIPMYFYGKNMRIYTGRWATV